MFKVLRLLLDLFLVQFDPILCQRDLLQNRSSTTQSRVDNWPSTHDGNSTQHIPQPPLTPYHLMRDTNGVTDLDI